MSTRHRLNKAAFSKALQLSVMGFIEQEKLRCSQMGLEALRPSATAGARRGERCGCGPSELRVAGETGGGTHKANKKRDSQKERRLTRLRVDWPWLKQGLKGLSLLLGP